MPKTKEIQLKEPVNFGGQEISELTIKYKLNYLRNATMRVTVNEGKGDEVGIDLNLGTIIDLASKMIGEAPALLDELGDHDRGIVMEEARDFLLGSLGTGANA